MAVSHCTVNAHYLKASTVGEKAPQKIRDIKQEHIKIVLVSEAADIFGNNISTDLSSNYYKCSAEVHPLTTVICTTCISQLF